MKEITITNANQNFTGMTGKVDKEKMMAITKNGKPKYVIMTYKEYELNLQPVHSQKIITKMKREPLWASQGKCIYYIETTEDNMIVRGKYIAEDGLVSFIKNIYDLYKVSPIMVDDELVFRAIGYPMESYMGSKRRFSEQSEENKTFAETCEKADPARLQKIKFITEKPLYNAPTPAQIAAFDAIEENEPVFIRLND
ncbi:MAG: type II toxin-antitoxin system Phd/YefM family antitoxin [Eubacteriaceae bacterium]|nr:type II toxin-antitoxin system Phd/YefM family antitoxin [Eubacteriaceae bacterium]